MKLVERSFLEEKFWVLSFFGRWIRLIRQSKSENKRTSKSKSVWRL